MLGEDTHNMYQHRPNIHVVNISCHEQTRAISIYDVILS